MSVAGGGDKGEWEDERDRVETPTEESDVSY
jgi:hypothetical protein